MKVKEMIGALQLHKKNTDSHQLMTVWGEHLDCTKVLEEYPRPQMVRSNYTILNGMWNYAFTSSSRMPEKYDGEILVPFSPESLFIRCSQATPAQRVLMVSENLSFTGDTG